jgi:hypothetical protein
MEWTTELTLSELLGDPIAQALMVADRVEQRDLDVLLATVRCHLRRQRGTCFCQSEHAPGETASLSDCP